MTGQPQADHPLANAQPPVALTIAGSDSGGGAGVQADLKTFAALGVFGTSALTAITAQNPAGVTAVQGIDPPVVAAQVGVVLDYFPVGAIKVGMLFSAGIITAVAEALDQAADGGNTPPPPLVVDPVMVATSGAQLLQDKAIDALCCHILPRATLITPNMAEAALLAERPVVTRDDLAAVAQALHTRFGVPVLVKGGHLRDSEEAVDILHDGDAPRAFTAPFLRGAGTHGTGCTLSSAIAAGLTYGLPLVKAIDYGKRYLTETLRNALPLGRSKGLNHGFAPLPLRADSTPASKRGAGSPP